MNPNTFNPVSLSLAENEWLLKHLGEPWALAGRDIHPVSLPNPHPKDKNPVHYPDGVIPAAVRPIIDKVYGLEELKKLKGEEWVGIDAIKACIQCYVAQSKRWAEDKRRGAPRFPSMHSFDSKGRPFRGGPGSDSGFVSTYFSPDGTRKPFALDYISSDQQGWVAEWAMAAAKKDQPTEGLVNNVEAGRWECFCGHTEKYDKESRASQNAAKGRMSRHLRKATDEVSRHREIHTAEFGTADMRPAAV